MSRDSFRLSGFVSHGSFCSTRASEMGNEVSGLVVHRPRTQHQSGGPPARCEAAPPEGGAVSLRSCEAMTDHDKRSVESKEVELLSHHGEQEDPTVCWLVVMWLAATYAWTPESPGWYSVPPAVSVMIPPPAEEVRLMWSL